MDARTAPSVAALIQELGNDLKPVKRLHPPLLRALVWLAVVTVTALVLAHFADRDAIAHRLDAAPDMWMAVLGSTLTTILGAIAVFQLSLPDRGAAWAWLPVPGVVLWIAATGLGCLRSWVIPDAPPASMIEAHHCFMFIVSFSVPLSILLVMMVRRACPLRPNLTAAVGGLTAAAAAATLLNFFHPFDVGATDLAVHLVAIAFVVVGNRLAGGRLLRR